MQTDDEDDLYKRIFDAAGDGLILHDLESGLVIEANAAACSLHGYAPGEFIGLHASTYIHSESYDQFVRSEQEVRAGKLFEATVVHLQRDGAPFTVEVRATGCVYGDRLVLLSALHPIGTRDATERLLRQQVMARMREQTTLLEISQTLASELELKPGLILDQLRVIIEYDHAALFALEGWDLVALAGRGSQRLEQGPPFRVRLGGAESLATLLNEHLPQRIADVWSDEPNALVLRSLLASNAAVLIEGMRAWMWVPLAVKGRIIGGVAVAHAVPDFFTAHHANLALTMANQAAIAMVNAQLYEQVQTHAALDERQRLAHNLHDAVNQSLFSASLIAEVLPRLWENHPDEVRDSLEDLRRLTRGALAEMRELLVELRPLVLDDTDLDDLLRLLGDALTGRTNIPVTVTVTGSRLSDGGERMQDTVPAEVQVAFYRLCQEALNNIARHSRAGQVAIVLQYEENAVAMTIRDDGRGFDPDQVPADHFGLSMMHERAEAVGARLSITSRPGHGAEVAVTWQEAPEQEAHV